MLSSRKHKGDIAQAKILADLLEKGFSISIPYGENTRYDLIAEKGGKLLRIQCKYSNSKGKGRISIKCHATGYKYTSSDVDYIASYDEVTKQCYYASSDILGSNGRSVIRVRIRPAKNGQVKRTNCVSKFGAPK